MAALTKWLVCLLLGVIVYRAQSTCSPSATNICVSFTKDGKFALDNGSGPSAQATLTLSAGVEYSFVAVAPSPNKFSTSPFALTTSSARANTPITDGVRGKNPLTNDGDRLVFRPSVVGPSLIYYQSMTASNLGGKLVITNACQPSASRVCVYHDHGSPGKYLVLSGQGAQQDEMQPGGMLKLTAGQPTTIQVVGPAFAQHPMMVTTSATGGSGAQPYTTGVMWSGPLSKDGASLVFTPAATGPSTLYYQSTNDPGMGGEIHVSGACIASSHHICVTVTANNKYAIDVGQGPVERAPLQLAAGDTYAFEMAAPEGVFELHPFALTESASGPASSLYTDGIQGDVPGNSDDMTFTFTPISRNGPTVLYYQSMNDANMGGRISISNTCSPTETHVCVSVDNSTGHYLLDAGDDSFAVSAEGNAMQVKAGVAYTFQAVGAGFHESPLSLTNSSARATPASVLGSADGISGANLLTKDGDTITFTPRNKGYPVVYFESGTREGAGGELSITGTCNPSETNICVSHDGAGSYLVDTGSGPVKNGALTLQAGRTYTFEAVGSDPFVQNPLSLTKDMKANPFEPFIDGVSGDNPAADDDQKLVFTPPVVGPTTLFYTSTSGRTRGGKIHIVGACMPGKRHVCVNVERPGGRFTLDMGEFADTGADSPAASRSPIGNGGGALRLHANVPYTFEATGPAGAFESNPFALSLTDRSGPIRDVLRTGVSAAAATDDASSSGSSSSSSSFGSSSLTAPTPAPLATEATAQPLNPLGADDQRFVFTPSATGYSRVYFGGTKTGGLGGFITIADTCNPSHTHICVTYDGKGAYMVNDGSGPVAHGPLTLYVGREYTFEVVGDAFKTRPFALTPDGTGRATRPLTQNVLGDNPSTSDDDRLTFIPDDSTPARLFYQSVTGYGLGGPISIMPGPAPYPQDVETAEPAPETDTPVFSEDQATTTSSSTVQSVRDESDSSSSSTASVGGGGNSTSNGRKPARLASSSTGRHIPLHGVNATGTGAAGGSGGGSSSSSTGLGWSQWPTLGRNSSSRSSSSSSSSSSTAGVILEQPVSPTQPQPLPLDNTTLREPPAKSAGTSRFGSSSRHLLFVVPAWLPV